MARTQLINGKKDDRLCAKDHVYRAFLANHDVTPEEAYRLPEVIGRCKLKTVRSWLSHARGLWKLGVERDGDVNVPIGPTVTLWLNALLREKAGKPNTLQTTPKQSDHPNVSPSNQAPPPTSAEPAVSQIQMPVLSEELVLDPPEILDPTEMKSIADELDEFEYFDPKDNTDARNRVLREIVQRAGQSRFREQLLVAYRNQCAVTGCRLVPVLEAAHIRRYLGGHTNTVRNGLLLRADIHTLFDLNLLGINPNDFTISVAASVARTSYKKLDGQKLRLPHDDSLKPSVELLRERWEDYWANSGER